MCVDSEVELRHTSIGSERTIPAKFEPSFIPFIPVGDEAKDFDTMQGYGAGFVHALIKEAENCRRENKKKYKAVFCDRLLYENMSRLHVYAYYKNAVGQCFKSTLTFEIAINRHSDLDNDQFSLIKIFQPAPCYTTIPIDACVVTREILARNTKRGLGV